MPSHHTLTQEVVLQFTDPHQLWAFSRQLSNPNLEIFLAQNKLICTCSATDVAKAVSQFGAKKLSLVKG